MIRIAWWSPGRGVCQRGSDAARAASPLDLSRWQAQLKETSDVVEARRASRTALASRSHHDERLWDTPPPFGDDDDSSSDDDDTTADDDDTAANDDDSSSNDDDDDRGDDDDSSPPCGGRLCRRQ